MRVLHVECTPVCGSHQLCSRATCFVPKNVIVVRFHEPKPTPTLTRRSMQLHQRLPSDARAAADALTFAARPFTNDRLKSPNQLVGDSCSLKSLAAQEASRSFRRIANREAPRRPRGALFDDAIEVLAAAQRRCGLWVAIAVEGDLCP